MRNTDKKNRIISTLINILPTIMSIFIICSFCNFCGAEQKEISKSDIWANVAFIHQKQENHDFAIKEYEEALKVDPANYKALCNLGLIHLKDEEYQKAVNIFNNYISLRPDDFRGYCNLGIAYVGLNDKTSAEQQTVMLAQHGYKEVADDLLNIIQEGLPVDGKVDYEKE